MPSKPIKHKPKSKSYFGGDDSDGNSDMEGGAGSDTGSDAGSDAGSDKGAEYDGNDSEVEFMNVDEEGATTKIKKIALDEDLGDNAGEDDEGEDVEDADEGEEDAEDIDEDEDDEDEKYVETDDEDEDAGDASGNPKSSKLQGKKVKAVNVYSNEDDSEGAGDDDGDGEEDDEDPDENYLQKFSAEINKNYITDFHPECIISNYDEVATLAVVVRDKTGIIIDDLHRTVPYLSKYERSRILGQRAKQINAGALAFVKVPEKVIDGYLIAEMELTNKTIPFIIRRPLPNGGSEYWRVNDLENIGF